jgi:hypothetical protein
MEGAGLHERGAGGRGGKGASSSGSTSSSETPFGGFENKIVYEVAGQMFRQAQTQAGGFMNIYANLDLIKPYFDVELPTVVRRLKMSFVPKESSELLTSGAPDLYGPTMIALTLVAILLLGMKLSHQAVEEGTLMGSAFGLCFSYWVVGSLGMRLLAYLCGMPLSVLEALALLGYGLGGYCVGLIMHYLLHSLSPVLSTIVLVSFGAASAATLAAVFWGELRHRNPSKAAIAAGSVGALHFLFLLYIRFFYASLYDAAAAAF